MTVNIRKSHDSNFAWAYGEEPVSFNKRNTVENAAFPWRRAVDGFYIAHDTLFANGIKVREGGRREYKLEVSEKNQLLNLLDEQTDAFRTGFSEKLSMELHRDGTASEDAVTGLDALVSLDTGNRCGGRYRPRDGDVLAQQCRHRRLRLRRPVRWQRRWKASGAAVSAMAVRRTSFWPVPLLSMPIASMG